MKIRALLFGILTATCVAAVFAQTMISGASVSRFALIKQLDVLFNPGLLGEAISVGQDPSACLQSIPKEFFVQNAIAHSQSVLWNPDSGCGQPLLADLANAVWNPIDLIFAPTNQKAYGFGIVLKFIAGAIFSFLLFIRNKAAPWAASVAALGFALAPRIISSAELATNFEMLPAVYLLFSYFRPGERLLKSILLAAGIAVCFLCLHPEVFFVAILCSTVIWFFETTAKPAHVRLSSIFLLGILSVSLVSPFLFSFLEYLQYAHSYKFADSSFEYIPVSDLVSNLYSPVLKNSLFPGFLSLLGLLPGLLVGYKRRPCTFIVLITLFLFACRPYPLNEIFAKAPFSYLLPEYALGSAFLLLCLFAGLGLSEISASENRPARRLLFFSLGLFSTLLALFDLYKFAPQTVSLSTKTFLISFAVVTVSGLIILFVSFWKRRVIRIRQFILPVFICLLLPITNTATLIGPAKATLPSNTLVELIPRPRAELIQHIKHFGKARIAACGTGLLVPNSALLYGAKDFRTCSPLNDRSYLKFTEAMGGRLGYCNMIELPAQLNKFADMAAISCILSEEPVRSLDDKNSEIIAPKSTASCRIMPGLRLESANSRYLPGSAEIDTEVELKVHENLGNRYCGRFVLKDSFSRVLWKSKMLVFAKNAQHRHHLNASIPTPCSKDSEPLSLYFKVIDTWTGADVYPDACGKANNKDLELAVFDIEKNKNIQSPDGRFVLVYETDDLLRLYRNTNALPRAYFCSSFKSAKSPQECMAYLNQTTFDPWKEVVVEANLSSSPESTSRPRIDPYLVKIESEANAEIKLHCENKSAGVLVLTDLYYPGWNCRIDGAVAPILRANSLFRAVHLSPGTHNIVFSYSPLPINIGLSLQSLVFLCLAFLICRRRPGQKSREVC